MHYLSSSTRAQEHLDADNLPDLPPMTRADLTWLAVSVSAPWLAALSIVALVAGQQ
jgi:hypothetical protein